MLPATKVQNFLDSACLTSVQESINEKEAPIYS